MEWNSARDVGAIVAFVKVKGSFAFGNSDLSQCFALGLLLRWGRAIGMSDVPMLSIPI